MKKMNRFFIILLSVVTALSCVACKKTSNTKDSEKDEPTKTLTLNYKEKEFVFGESLSLIANYEREEGKTLTWRSTNPSVATVNDEGDVSSVAIGETDIIATYGDLEAVCKVKVGFGNLYPNLVLENISNDTIKLSVGEKYAFNGYVDFNDKIYRDIDLNATVDDESVVNFSNGEFTALSVGETFFTVDTTWMNFTGATLTKNVKVEVVEDVAINTYAEIEERSEIVNNLHLYSVDSWQDNEYITQAKLNTVVIENGVEKKEGVTYETSDGSVVEIEDGTVKATGVGIAEILIKYTSETGEYTNKIGVEVSCPIVEYNDTFELCTSDNIDVETLFGRGTVILSAKQGNKTLKVIGGKKLDGVEVNGYDTEKMEIVSSVGGYSFSSVYAYTKKITTEEEFKDTFTLANGKIIDGYFVLGNDITVDMTSQKVSFYGKNNPSNTYFKGVFDGSYRKEFHTVNATVGDAGLFGGLGNGALVENTHFNFTFAYSTNNSACGIAKNAGAVFIGTDSNDNVVLSNLKITTTNYFDGKDGSNKRSYSIFDFMNYKISLKDIFVVITGATNTYTEYTQEVGALFHIDCNSMCASTTSMYRNTWENVRVVSGVFMPMSNGQYGSYQNNLSYYATYAQTDFSNDATKNMMLVGDHSGRSEVSSYCKIIINNKTSESQKNLFGDVFYVENDGSLGKQTYAWVYFSLLPNGGVYRYNTVSELKNVGIRTVGTWTV